MFIDKVLYEHHRLTTAEIYYYYPDHPLLLQTYLWQEFDLAPDFPILNKFLNFWENSLDGKLHSVDITSCEDIEVNQLFYAKETINITQ